MDIKHQVLPDFSCILHTLPWGGPSQSLWLQHHWKESHKHSRAQDILLGSRLTYIHLPLGSLTDPQLSISTPKVVTCPEASFLPAPCVSGMVLPTAVTFSWECSLYRLSPWPFPSRSHLSRGPTLLSVPPAPFLCAGPTPFLARGGFYGPPMASNSAQAFTTQQGYCCPVTHKAKIPWGLPTALRVKFKPESGTQTLFPICRQPCCP